MRGRELRKKQLLGICIFSSLCLHAFGLIFLQRHSLWPSPINLKPTPAMEALAKGEILREAFQALAKVEPSAPLFPQKTLAAELPEALLPLPEIQFDIPPLSFPSPKPLHSDDLLVSSPAPSLIQPDTSASLELFSSKLPTFPAPAVPSLAAFTPLKHPEPTPDLDPLATTSIVLPETKEIAYRSLSTQSAALAEGEAFPRVSLSTPSFPPLVFPTLDDLETSSYSDAFDLEILCSPRQDQPGYLFALTLIPHAELHLPKIHQHYTFLLDRSNAIQRERLLASKQAILRALEELDPQDTFNIFVFDSRVEKLFPAAKTPDPLSMKAAIAFLDKIQLGSFFTSADLYNPLLMILPPFVQEDELHTAILLTDGEHLAKKAAARAILRGWTWQNQGKVTLFTIGMGSDAQLPALDVVSAFNKGRLYHSPTKRGIKRKLLKLMKSIHTPIAKNISCKAITKSSKTSVDLLPKFPQMPNLYLDQPIVMVGSSDTLDDFILFVQGRLKDRWINIKKSVSFAHAKQGNQFLRQEWALQEAYQHYERYLIDDNPEHLARVQELLMPFDIQPALQ